MIKCQEESSKLQVNCYGVVRHEEDNNDCMDNERQVFVQIPSGNSAIFGKTFETRCGKPCERIFLGHGPCR
jgi:hypothetical protein